jgi:hypothetical protein
MKKKKSFTIKFKCTRSNVDYLLSKLRYTLEDVEEKGESYILELLRRNFDRKIFAFEGCKSYETEGLTEETFSKETPKCM